MGAAMGIAILFGLLAGFYRRVDAALMRLVDGLMAFPRGCDQVGDWRGDRS